MPVIKLPPAARDIIATAPLGENGKPDFRALATRFGVHRSTILREWEKSQAPAPAATAPADQKPGQPAAGEPDAGMMIAWDAIDPSPLNPRKYFSPQSLADLADNIVTMGGIKQTVLVRCRDDVPGRFWLIAGERRHRAFGLLVQRNIFPPNHPIPARREVDCDDTRHIQLALIENLQRADMNPMEEAEGFAALIQRGQSAADIARLVLGQPQRSRYVQLRLEIAAKLSPRAAEALRRGAIGAEQARVLKAAAPDVQDQLLDQIQAAATGFETADQLRRRLAERLIPVSRWPHLRAAFDGPILAEDDVEFYADPIKIQAIRASEIAAIRTAESGRAAWVTMFDETAGQWSKLHDYEQIPGHDRAGTVLVIHHQGPVAVHRDMVARADLDRLRRAALASGQPPDSANGDIAQTSPQPAGQDAADFTATPWTKAHLAHAKRRQSTHLRAKMSAAAATRLHCLLLLAGCPCLDLAPAGKRSRPENRGPSPQAETIVKGFLTTAGLAAAHAVDDEGRIRIGSYAATDSDRLTLWRALETTPPDALATLFAALTALRFGLFTVDNGDDPAVSPLARAIADHIDPGGEIAPEPADLDGLRRPALVALAKINHIDAAALSATQIKQAISAQPNWIGPHTLRWTATPELLRAALGAPPAATAKS